MSKRALKRLATCICFAFCIVLLGQIYTFADEVKPAWEIRASMLDRRDFFQTEVINGKIYAIGGRSGLNNISSVEVYDPSTDTWTTLAPMSTPRINFRAEVLNGKIYAIGGSGGTVEVYDPNTDTWTTLASMSKPRAGFRTEVINGKIYAIGGSTASSEVYDPNTDTWTTLASLSTSRISLQTEVIEGKIYAIGGNNLSSAEVYDPTTDTWTTLAPMSTIRTMFRTEVVNGKIYAIGGTITPSTNSGFSSIEVYDPTTDTWSTLTPMSIGRYGLQTEVINGKIYAIGGISAKPIEVYDPSTDTWTTLASMSTDRYLFQTEVINEKIYAIGGARAGSGCLSSMETYTVTNDTSNLKATGGDSKVDLTWDTVDKATGYTVKRATTAGGPYIAVATDLTDTSYTDSDVKNGTTYYYIVSSINAGAEIGNSNEASAKPTEDQTPPTTDSKLKVVMEISEALRLSVDNDLNVNTQMSWYSSDPTVATVNEKGIVTALAPGNTVITVKRADGSYTDYINVLVVENADDYRLAIDLRVGETARLTADDFTNTANITWAPMDSSIANVTTKGKVTALSKGLVLISAKDADGNIIGRVYVRVRE